MHDPSREYGKTLLRDNSLLYLSTLRYLPCVKNGYEN